MRVLYVRSTKRKGNRRCNAGFTLIELIVAIGVFSTVVSIAVGGFVRVLRTQRQVVGLLSANSNASLVIEQMAREIRTGFDFCRNGQVCVGTSELSFRNAAGERITYRIQNDVVERGVNNTFAALTASNVNIRNLVFDLSGQDSNDGFPPRVTISMGVSSKELGVAGTVVNMETTVSARALDG
jgi:prepilin-type N-terminal cleavage/methylation domain-containing protein